MQTTFAEAPCHVSSGARSSVPIGGRSIRVGAAITLALVCHLFAPVVAAAGEQEDQQACTNDALTICSQFIPDRERVASCLISNRSRVSQACRIALIHFKQRPAPAKLTAIH